MRPRLAASVALRIASGTSRALPWPKPTRPFWSPTTTSAAKPNLRPPFTTLATRLIWTKRSMNSPSRSSRSRPRPPSPSRAICLFHIQFVSCLVRRGADILCAARVRIYVRLALEFEPAFAGAFRQRLDTSVIHVGTAVEHDFAYSGPRRTLGKLLTDDLRRLHRCPALQAFPV